MLPVDFEGSNLTMVKPENMTAEECADIRVLAVRTHRGPQYTTCWKPSYEDMQAINNNKPVVIEMYVEDTIYVNISTRLHHTPALTAHNQACVWVPGQQELKDLKSGCPLYITFLATAFPVMSVYTNLKND